MTLTYVALAFGALTLVSGTSGSIKGSSSSTMEVEFSSNFLMDTGAYLNNSGAISFDGSVVYDTLVTRTIDEHFDATYIVHVNRIIFSAKNGNNVIASAIADVDADYEWSNFANGTTNVSFVYGRTSVGVLTYRYSLNVSDETYFSTTGSAGLNCSYPINSAIYKTYEFDFSHALDAMETEFYKKLDNSYEAGYLAGKENGYALGSAETAENLEASFAGQVDEAWTDGYQYGYGIGVHDGNNKGTTLTTLFWSVIDEPFAVIYRLFNFEVLGVNLMAFISGLVTLGLIGFVIKMII